MYDNYNYPTGADNEYAPWNEPTVPEKEFDVTCSQTLSKTVTVITNDYIPGASGVDYESDGEGGSVAFSWHDDDDTSDTDWASEYHSNDLHTPLELIQLFKAHLENELNDELPKNKVNLYKHLIDECNDWVEDECEIVEG